jgi:hypothetical protein
MIRAASTIALAILVLTFFAFSGFRMESRLHCSHSSVFNKKENDTKCLNCQCKRFRALWLFYGRLELGYANAISSCSFS